MTLSLHVHELAERELNDAADYYDRVRPGLGSAFLGDVEAALAALAQSPLAGPPLEGAVRAWLVQRFPYRIFYVVREDHVRVLALAHHRRRPTYWSERR